MYSLRVCASALYVHVRVCTCIMHWLGAGPSTVGVSPPVAASGAAHLQVSTRSEQASSSVSKWRTGRREVGGWVGGRRVIRVPVGGGRALGNRVLAKTLNCSPFCLRTKHKIIPAFLKHSQSSATEEDAAFPLVLRHAELARGSTVNLTNEFYCKLN